MQGGFGMDAEGLVAYKQVGLWYGCKGLGGLQASGGSAGKKQGIQFEQLVGTQCTAIFSTAEQAVYSAEGRV